MNILFITSLYPTTATGNAFSLTHALHNFVKHWHPQHRIVVICPVYLYASELLKLKKTGKPLQKQFLSIDNIDVIVFPIFKIPKIAYFYYPLYRFLDKYLVSIDFLPDVVVAHYDKSLEIGFHYSQKRDIPFVAGFHITPDLTEENSSAFTHRCGKIVEKASACACRSHAIYNKISGWFPEYKQKCFVAFSGVDETLIVKKEFALDKLNRWKQGGKISFITVSSLIERKKIDSIFYALAKFQEETFDWSYTIIGTGEEWERLETLARTLQISNRVCFTGPLSHDETISQLKNADIFILVSTLETVGLVYLEAMASGNIVIGSSGEGIDGIIENGRNGFLVPSGDADALYATLRKIVRDISREEMENIIKESLLTIGNYTEQKASENYLEHLMNIKDSAGKTEKS